MTDGRPPVGPTAGSGDPPNNGAFLLIIFIILIIILITLAAVPRCCESCSRGIYRCRGAALIEMHKSLLVAASPRWG